MPGASGEASEEWVPSEERDVVAVKVLVQKIELAEQRTPSTRGTHTHTAVN